MELFSSLTQKSGLYSCSFTPITNQLSWVTKGTRWGIWADSVESHHGATQPTQWSSATGNQPVSISPRKKIVLLFSQNPCYYKRNYFGSKAFFNSGQTNDCGSLGTQVLWKVLKLTTSKFWVSAFHLQRPTTRSVFSPVRKKMNSYLVLLWINYPPEVNTYLPRNIICT